MAWYTQHTLRYRGRLVSIMTRYGCLQSANVVKGNPLDLGDVECPEKRTWDGKRLHKLFLRDKTIRREISDFLTAYAEEDRH